MHLIGRSAIANSSGLWFAFFLLHGCAKVQSPATTDSKATLARYALTLAPEPGKLLLRAVDLANGILAVDSEYRVRTWSDTSDSAAIPVYLAYGSWFGNVEYS